MIAILAARTLAVKTVLKLKGKKENEITASVAAHNS
jgi:hypothetical protein